MHRLRITAIAAGLLVAFAVSSASAEAQGIDRIREALLQQVMPEADRFGPAEGDPPIRRAYKGEELVGYVFHTSDFPPEEVGYNSVIRALVGMKPDGHLTGVRVTDYHESRMNQKGDFLRQTPGFLEQYEGKYIGDGFRVYEDIAGISRVSISVRALSRGVRNTARTVAATYSRVVAEEGPRAPAENVTSMPWFEMRRVGVASRMTVNAEESDEIGISVIHLENDELALYLIGALNGYIKSAVERRNATGADLILYVVDGAGSRLPVQQGWSVVQNGNTLPMSVDSIVMLGSPWEGLLSGETSMVGAFILNDQIDVEQPMTFVYDRGEEIGRFEVEYTSQAALRRAVVVAAERAAAEAAAAAAVAASNPAGPAADAAPDAAASPATSATAAPAPFAETDDQLDALDFTFEEDEEEGAFAGLLASTSWLRVGWTVLVLALAGLAFFTKIPALRWVSLAATFGILGFADGGFLSISHITGVIWIGPSAIMNDLPLMIMVAFTLVTVVFWGRVFCGYLCPFGALQDFIDRVVPARFKKELPTGTHRAALKAKYVILALIILPALAGSETSIYQYFEPFGTVFFLSTDVVLWSIAGTILLASVVVPRFYCRYACPLGASLAIASMISLKRIPRVEQCDYCKVCEQRCPTGAIQGPQVDFKECVRCNDCEVQLIQRTGVCRHDMEEFRPRLVQLQARRAAAAASAASSN
jgi:NosR/NirI family nitrous oxide reductase transcriptional regulator